MIHHLELCAGKIACCNGVNLICTEFIWGDDVIFGNKNVKNT